MKNIFLFQYSVDGLSSIPGCVEGKHVLALHCLTFGTGNIIIAIITQCFYIYETLKRGRHLVAKQNWSTVVECLLMCCLRLLPV